MRIIITGRNIKEETLKRELHSVKMQLNSTIDHNKLMKEEVATLKKDFKQKENKYLKDFLDMKALKEKVEDKLFKQDQSLQTLHMLCKPKPFYDEKKKVAIGYKNPLYLTGVMQVQSALYNGHEIVNTNHSPTVVHDLEDTLEIAKITRKKMLEKMKSPMWIEGKIKIAPPNYSKENYLAIFTPQKQLSANQIFWSSVPKPISKMTVYPHNTPAKLVPRVLPTKSQVKINIYTLTQLFTEFDKTCKKRITPCGLAKGERGFEQTKKCYLTERRSEADRNFDFKALDSQNIELKEHVTALQEQNEHFRTENEKVKQHYKELYDSIKITRAKTIEKTSSLLTENGKLKAQLKGKMQCVTMPTVKPKVLAPGMYAIDVEPILLRDKNNRVVHLDYLKHLKESAETLREIVEEARIEKPLDNTLENACFYTKRSQELNKQVAFRETYETSNNNTQTHVEQLKVHKTNVPVIPSTGVNSSTEASGSKPRSNTKNKDLAS
ncbi:hypothetical protein Tco_1194970 [Tanacetum coccineum]